MINQTAPELETAHWFNSQSPISLDELRGRVVVIEVFQMLCPGCVSQGLPQAMRIFETFRKEDVVVLGLHSVFEHHEGQGSKASLAAFLHEYRIQFPVGMDAPGSNSMPRTMTRYQMQGTPTLLLIDREGKLRRQHFGVQPDLALGAEIMMLVSESRTPEGISTVSDE